MAGQGSGGASGSSASAGTPCPVRTQSEGPSSHCEVRMIRDGHALHPNRRDHAVLRIRREMVLENCTALAEPCLSCVFELQDDAPPSAVREPIVPGSPRDAHRHVVPGVHVHSGGILRVRANPADRRWAGPAPTSARWTPTTGKAVPWYPFRSGLDALCPGRVVDGDTVPSAAPHSLRDLTQVLQWASDSRYQARPHA
jgi:hypothetical protein